MSIEEDLQNMLKHFSAGKGLPFEAMLKNLMNTVEVNTLTQMQTELSKMQDTITKRVQQLAAQRANVAASGLGDEDLNPYTILGVGMDASEQEVKKAYRKAATKAHPDKGGSNEKMMLVNAAYEAIKRFRGWQ